MNELPPLPELWRAMCEADTALLVRRHQLRQREDFLPLLARALADPAEQHSALRFLRDDVGGLDEAQLAELAPTIVDIAVDGNLDRLIVARDVLIRYAAHFTAARRVVRDAVEASMSGCLATQDGFALRRLAELLVGAGLSELLQRLLAACEGHADPDIAEMREDFSRYSG